MSNEIDNIVCWDVNDDDKTDLHNRGLTLEKIGESNLFRNSTEYLTETTHQIIISNVVKPIYIIDLKLMIDKIEEQ